MKSADTYYKISCFEKKFFSMGEAKKYIHTHCAPGNLFSLEGASIMKYVNEKPFSEKKITVREDGYIFSRTIKL